jgi:hypothetical protein
MVVWSDSFCERIGKWKTCPVVDVRLAGVSLTTATLRRLLTAAVAKVMSGCTSHGKTTSTKNNSGQKSTLTESDRHKLRRTVSKHHRTYCSTDDSKTEYSSADFNIVEPL